MSYRPYNYPNLSITPGPKAAGTLGLVKLCPKAAASCWSADVATLKLTNTTVNYQSQGSVNHIR